MFFYEADRYGQNDSFWVWPCENMTFPIHLHRSFEFLYVRQGQVVVEVDQDKVTLGPDEMVLIFPNQLHSYLTPEYSDSLICIFSPEFVSLFSRLAQNKKQAPLVTKLNPDTRAYILSNIRQCEDNRFRIKSVLYALCAEVFEKTTLVEKSISGDHALIHKILMLIENHYAEELSLQIIAKKLGYNYQYLSRFFNAQFKMPFTRMLNARRVDYAAYLIKNTDQNITDIALSCGYKSIRSFNRNFQRVMGQSPREYRER